MKRLLPLLLALALCIVPHVVRAQTVNVNSVGPLTFTGTGNTPVLSQSATATWQSCSYSYAGPGSATLTPKQSTDLVSYTTSGNPGPVTSPGVYTVNFAGTLPQGFYVAVSGVTGAVIVAASCSSPNAPNAAALPVPGGVNGALYSPYNFSQSPASGLPIYAHGGGLISGGHCNGPGDPITGATTSTTVTFTAPAAFAAANYSLYVWDTNSGVLAAATVLTEAAGSFSFTSTNGHIYAYLACGV